jgi:hypothetical protein
MESREAQVGIIDLTYIHFDKESAFPPLTQPPRTYLRGIITAGYMSTHHKENNARLKPDVLALLAEQAQAENKTVDDLLNEAARRLLETRRDIDGLRSLVSENRAHAIKDGWTERSVASVVKKHRQEKRVR